MAALDPSHEPAGEEDHPKDHHDEQQDAGTGTKRAVFQVAFGQRLGHRRRHPADPGDGNWNSIAQQPWELPSSRGPVLRRRGSDHHPTLFLLLQ